MIANYNMVIDFARPTKSNTIVVSEYDANTRNCNFKLLFDKQPFDMTGVVSAIVKATTSQGTIVFGEATIHEDSEGNYINELSYLLPAQITDTAGNTTMTIELQDNVGGRITSFEFYIKVRNALYNEDDYIDDDDLEGFRDLLQRSQAALAAMEEMVTQDALPNPYPLRINGIDDYDLEYKGDDLVQFVMDEVAYLGTTSGTVTTTEDDSAAAVAVAAAEAAEASAEDAEETKQDVITYFENFQSQIPTVSVEKVDHTATVTITDREGSSTADIYDGDKGDKGDKGDAATVAVGTVTTGEPGTDATVVNSGTSTDAVFDFTIPRGASAVADLNELTDVTITSPSDGDILTYDGDDSEWVNRSVDSTPTDGSKNLVESNGVYDALVPKFTRNENAVLGARNVLPPNETKTINNIVFTSNDNGSVKAHGANSSTNNTLYPLYPADSSYTANKWVGWKLSGCTGGSASTFFIYALYSNGTSYTGETDVFDGEETIQDYPYVRFGICVCGSQSVSNQMFYPMLKLPTDPDNTFSQYAMTNKDLTDGIKSINTKMKDVLTTTLVTTLNGSSANCNDAPKGLCQIQQNVQNTPQNWFNVVTYNLDMGGANRGQLGIASNNGVPVIYFRQYNANAWTAWKSVSLENKSTTCTTPGNTASVNEVKRRGDVVMVNLYFASPTVYSNTAIANIPDGYRPSKNIYVPACFITSYGPSYAAACIKTNGDVVFENQSTTNAVSVFATYIA